MARDTYAVGERGSVIVSSKAGGLESSDVFLRGRCG